MKAITTEDVAVLIPNTEHKNFTESNEIIEKNTTLNGELKNIEGLRRGKPFTYRMFVTNGNQLIYSKSIKPMETTEVYLGANGASTTVNLKPAETFSQAKVMGLVVGGAAGYAYAKYKKGDNKKLAMFIGIGALVGYAAAYYLDSNKSITVNQTK
jgi:hypothetical protein